MSDLALPVEIGADLCANGEAGVRIRLGLPLVTLIAHLLSTDPDVDALPADLALASVPGEDVFAQLEAEIVADRVSAALAQRRGEARDHVSRLLSRAASNDGILDEVLEVEEAQTLLEWLNRMYVTSRTAELADAEADATVGQSQSPSMFLGLDDVLDVAGQDDPAEGSGDGAEQVPMGLLTVLLAVLVSELQTTLDDLPDAPA